MLNVHLSTSCEAGFLHLGIQAGMAGPAPFLQQRDHSMVHTRRSEPATGKPVARMQRLQQHRTAGRVRRERSSKKVRHKVPRTLCRMTRYRWIRCRPPVFPAPMFLRGGVGAVPPWSTSACAAAPAAPRSASLAMCAAPIARDGSPPAAALARNAAVAAVSVWLTALPTPPGPQHLQAPPARGLQLEANRIVNQYEVFRISNMHGPAGVRCTERLESGTD